MGTRTYKPHSLLSFAQAANVLGLTRDQVRGIADKGLITCHVLPGCVRRIRRMKYAELVGYRQQIEASASVESRGPAQYFANTP